MPEPRSGGAQLNSSSVSGRYVEVLVVGAGVAGLATAIALARAGVPVDVLEQDRSPAPAGRRAAGSWRRDGVPQANHAHTFSPACYRLLAEQLPDVLARLLELGARELVSSGPDGVQRRALGVRRPVFDWVLRRAAEREPALRVHEGVAAEGLRRGPDGPFEVLVSGGVLRASAVVDATGANGLLTGTGAAGPGESAGTGAAGVGGSAGAGAIGAGELPGACAIGADEGSVASGRPTPLPAPRGAQAQRVHHFSRDYALHWPEDPTELNLGAAAGGQLPGYTCRVVPGDNHTFTVSFAVPAGGMSGQHAGQRWLAGLGTTEGFEAATRLVPVVSEWVDPAVAEPLGPVHSVSTPKHGARRALAAVELPGLFAVGDALRGDDRFAAGNGGSDRPGSIRAGAERETATAPGLERGGQVLEELGGGCGVAAALASAGACARAVRGMLAGDEPDSSAIAAVLDDQSLAPTGSGPPLAGPSAAELAELLRRMPAVPA